MDKAEYTSLLLGTEDRLYSFINRMMGSTSNNNHDDEQFRESIHNAKDSAQELSKIINRCILEHGIEK